MLINYFLRLIQRNIELICVLICIHYYFRLMKCVLFLFCFFRGIPNRLPVRCFSLHFLKLCLFVYSLCLWSQGIVLFELLWLWCEWVIVWCQMFCFVYLRTDKCIRHPTIGFFHECTIFSLEQRQKFNYRFFCCVVDFMLAGFRTITQ